MSTLQRNFLISLVLLSSISFLEAENISIDKIDNHIKMYQKYLDKIPIELQNIKKKGFELKRKREELELVVNRYLKLMDTCATSKLEPLALYLCKELIKSDYGDMLTEKKEKLQEYIEFIEREKEKAKNIQIEIEYLKEVIQFLKDVRQMLLE